VDPDVGHRSRPRLDVGGADKPSQRPLLLAGQLGQFRCFPADFAPAPGHQR